MHIPSLLDLRNLLLMICIFRLWAHVLSWLSAGKSFFGAIRIEELPELYNSQPSTHRFRHFSVWKEVGSHSTNTLCLEGFEKLQPIILRTLGFIATILLFLGSLKWHFSINTSESIPARIWSQKLKNIQDLIHADANLSVNSKELYVFEKHEEGSINIPISSHVSIFLNIELLISKSLWSIIGIYGVSFLKDLR